LSLQEFGPKQHRQATGARGTPQEGAKRCKVSVVVRQEHEILARKQMRPDPTCMEAAEGCGCDAEGKPESRRSHIETLRGVSYGALFWLRWCFGPRSFVGLGYKRIRGCPSDQPPSYTLPSSIRPISLLVLLSNIKFLALSGGRAAQGICRLGLDPSRGMSSIHIIRVSICLAKVIQGGRSLVQSEDLNRMAWSSRLGHPLEELAGATISTA
jgi:hypothetical protein